MSSGGFISTSSFSSRRRISITLSWYTFAKQGRMAVLQQIRCGLQHSKWYVSANPHRCYCTPLRCENNNTLGFDTLRRARRLRVWPSLFWWVLWSQLGLAQQHGKAKQAWLEIIEKALTWYAYHTRKLMLTSIIWSDSGYFISNSIVFPTTYPLVKTKQNKTQKSAYFFPIYFIWKHRAYIGLGKWQMHALKCLQILFFLLWSIMNLNVYAEL